MTRRIFVLGLSGTGKSTVIKNSDFLKTFDYIVLGDFIKSIGEEATGQTDRDAIRRDSQTETFRQIQRKAFKKLKEATDKKDVIIDTHALVSTKSGMLPGLNFALLKALKPDLFVVIESEPQELLNRRKKDQGTVRNRDINDLQEVKFIQTLERDAALVYSVYSAAPFRVINNREGKPKEAAAEFETAVKNL
ncbi:MAG: AAA family ATPase [Candidatus Bathyarchaeota archaeon]|nr:AAA family ATPase [Candidatus Bathyarchaeota archaeon]